MGPFSDIASDMVASSGVWFALLCGIFSGIFAAQGSLASIKDEWHEEPVYSKRIKPAVSAVTIPSFTVGWIAGMIIFAGSLEFNLDAVGIHYLRFIIRALPSITVATVLSYLLARTRGRRIYSARIRNWRG